MLARPTTVPQNTLTPPPEALQYLPAYKVVVCISCKYAIQPKAIARHLKEIHRIKLADRQPYMQYVETFELAEHEIVMQYQPSDFPVPLLPVQSGLQCTSEECTYLCKTEKRMKHHWLSVHGRHGVAANNWQTVPLQTFFKGNLLRYFTSTPTGKSTGTMNGIPDQSMTNGWTEKLSDPSLTPPTSTSSSIVLGESDELLMHHFTKMTWQSLTKNENMRVMWRDTVPQLAYQQEYLMHALLACAAFHKAYLNPEQEKELMLQARNHQGQAIMLFMAAIPAMARETCDAVLIFVRLVGITGFGLDETLFNMGEQGAKEAPLPSWIFFIRSGCTMFCDVWGDLGTGPVRYLAESWELLDALCQTPHPALLEYFMTIPANDEPEKVRACYNESAIALAKNFSCLPYLNDRITTLEVVRYWPIQNSLEFVDLLEKWHPGALILLAHYSIILHRMSARSWAIKGTAAHLLSIIVRRLDASWHRYIEWPLNEVGLPPTIQRITDELQFGSLDLSGNPRSSFDH